MEGLLPVLIAVGISIAISLLKKKPAPPTESDTLPQDSPWDDLLKEIQRQQSAPEPKTEYEQYEPEAQSLETIPEQSEVSPSATPSVMPSVEVVQAPQMWRQQEVSLDAEEHIPFDYEEDAIALSAPEADVLTDTASVKENPQVVSRAENKAAGIVTDQDHSAESRVFHEGFDPRMAVLYAEVMRPKYQEY